MQATEERKEMVNRTQIVKGILEGCVLKVLGGEKCYAGELADRLKACGFKDISTGTLFPLLLRLEKDGAVEAERVPNELGPMRKYYHLTEKGKADLELFSETWEEIKSIVDGVMKKGE